MRFWVALVACLLVAALLGAVPDRGAAAEVESEIWGTADDDWVTISMVDDDVVANWGGESLVLPTHANIVVKLRNGDDRFVIDQDVEYASLTVEGQLGNDSIVGGAGDDVLDGGVGDDIVIGGGGDDQISGSTQDQIPGHTDDDILIGGFGKNTIADDQADTVYAAAVIYDEADLPKPALDLYHLMIEQHVMLHAGPDETAAVDTGTVPAEVVITDNAGVYHEDWSNTVSVPIDSLFEIDAVVSAYEADPSPATLSEINKIFQSKPDYVRFLVWWLHEDDTEDSRVTDLNYVFDETIEPYIAQNADADYIQYYGEGLFGYNNGAMFIPTIGALDWHGTDSDTVDTFVEYEKLQNIRNDGNHEAITSLGINPDTNKIEVAVYDDPDNPVDLPAIKADLAHLKTAEFYLTDVPHQTGEDLIEEVEEEVEIPQDRGLQVEEVTPIIGERVNTHFPRSRNIAGCSLGGHWQLGSGEIVGGITAGHCTSNLARSILQTTPLGLLNSGGDERLHTADSTEMGYVFANYERPGYPGPRNPLQPITTDVMFLEYYRLNTIDNLANRRSYSAVGSASALLDDNGQNKSIKKYLTTTSLSPLSIFENVYTQMQIQGTEVCITGTPKTTGQIETNCSAIKMVYHTKWQNDGTPNVPLWNQYELVMLEDQISPKGMSGGPAFTRNVDGTVNNIGIVWGVGKCPCDQTGLRILITPMPQITQRIRQTYAGFSWITE